MMLDTIRIRLALCFVWLLNHVPFGPRFDLEIVEIELEGTTEKA